MSSDTTDAPPPVAPDALSATANGSSRIDLAWQDNSGNEDGFGIERSVDGANFSPYNSADSNTDSETTDAASAISLILNGYKIKGKHHIDLNWSGTTAANVDIFRDGALHETVPDTGAFTDATSNKGGRTYEYQVCEAKLLGSE